MTTTDARPGPAEAAGRTPPRRDKVRAPGSGGPPPAVLLAMATFTLLLLAAIFPSVFATHDPYAANPARLLEAPSAGNWFGTDEQGRDLFSRIVYGARASIFLGIAATAIGLAGGAILGVLAGYARGALDRVLSRIIDVLLAFPDVLLALITITILGAGQANLLWAIGIGRIPGAARLVRSQVLHVRSSGYVKAGVALGLPRRTLVLRHVVPNSMNSVLIASVLGIGTSIIFGASLSFLGLGGTGSEPEWGWMISQAQNFIRNSPWVALWPGLAITVTVISVTVTGRWLQERYVTKRSAL